MPEISAGRRFAGICFGGDRLWRAANLANATRFD
jgi:hypothetical protein